MGTPVRRSGVASSESTFLRLLSQEQPVEPEGLSCAVPSFSESAGDGSGAGMGVIAPKSFPSLLRMTSDEPGSTPKRRKASAEADTGALAPAPQSPDISKAAHWRLSLTSGETPVARPLPPSIPERAAQPSNDLSERFVEATSLPLQDNALAAPELSLELLMPNRDGEPKVAAGAVSPETIDPPLFAELSLTRSADPTVASQIGTPKSDSPLVPTPASSCARRSEGAEISSQPTTSTERPDTHVFPLRDHGPGSGGSSPDSSSDRQQAATAGPKKNEETGGAQRENFIDPSFPGVIDQRVVPSNVAPGVEEPRGAAISPDLPTVAPTTSDPVTSAAPKPGGSAVGAIELQINSPDQRSVGLRIVERQGRVEIQMKSADQQTARALSENLGALKTSLNETGWDVESRVQTRIAPIGQVAQTAATADRGSVPSAGYQSTNLSARFSFDSSFTPADRSNSVPLHPMEQVSSAQMSRQSGSDSSASQDHSRPDQSDPSGRNGQQGRNDNASADSGGQGRRSARDSEAWLESMESNLTQSSSVRFTTGVTQ